MLGVSIIKGGFMKVFITLFLLVSLFFSTNLFAKDDTKLDAFLCNIGNIEFVDGDSFKCKGEEIRVLGVDAPELMNEKNGILKNQKMGPKAALFTQKELKDASRILIVRGGKDKYNRTLAHVMVDGDLLSVKLIKAGLGYETITKYGDNGFPLYSSEVLDTALGAPKPKFKDPYVWRQKNKKSSIVKR